VRDGSSLSAMPGGHLDSYWDGYLVEPKAGGQPPPPPPVYLSRQKMEAQLKVIEDWLEAERLTSKDTPVGERVVELLTEARRAGSISPTLDNYTVPTHTEALK
jgi:hypothetical protein